MKTRILQMIVLLAVIGLAMGSGYFFGFRNATHDAVRNNSAALLPFFIGIHELLVEGDIESAKHISAGCAEIQILAIDNIERYPLILEFWSMFPYKGMPDFGAMKDRNLGRAYEYFSTQPKMLTPEAMAYLQKHSNEK
jgi:hypothetical protein